MQTTRLGRRWLTTKFIFMVVLLAFGIWGFLDATVFYKNRGLNDASYKLKVYLEAARSAGRLSPGSVRVEDPAAVRQELRGRRNDLMAASTGDSLSARQAAFDLARLDWLDSLAAVWMLRPDPQDLGRSAPPASAPGAPGGSARSDGARHLFFDPVKGEGFSTATGKPADPRTTVELGGLLDELTRKWNTQPKAKPLSSYDMAVQWIFVTVGIGGGLYLAVVLLRAASTKYRWDPGAKRLELPGGRAIVPADLKDVDKRKWHKFYVTLNLNDGSNVELDLYKFDPLEAWVLEMERTAFPDRAKDETRAAPVGARSAASDGGGSGEGSVGPRGKQRGESDAGPDNGNGGGDGGGGDGD